MRLVLVTRTRFWPIFSVFFFVLGKLSCNCCVLDNISSEQNNYYSDNKHLMSFAPMKVWRYDDKTISYVKTFPRIWTMAVMLTNILMLFHFSSSINHTYLSFEKFVEVIKTCLHYQFGSYQYPRWVSFWVISTRFLTEHSLCLSWYFSLIFVPCNCTECVTQAVTKECIWPGTSHYWETIRDCQWSPNMDTWTWGTGVLSQCHSAPYPPITSCPDCGTHIRVQMW